MCTLLMALIDKHGVVEAPTCDDIASWAVSAHWDMDGKPMLRKAWKKTGYSWFKEDEPTADETEPVVAEGGVIFLDKEEAWRDQYDDFDDIEK